MIRVAVIGMGFMGGVHLRAWQALKDVEVVAVFSQTPDIKSISGNIDTGSEQLNLGGISIYTRIADLLDAEDLDAVSITLPTHLHREVSIQCLEAGLHVLCEKPMALSLEDCDEMRAVAAASGLHLMIAHCIRFWPEYAWLKGVVERGTFGGVKAAEFSRLTYAPAWDGDSWFSDPEKSGGLALDLHIHDLDFIHYCFGMPRAIETAQAFLQNGMPGHTLSRLDYDAGPLITATASWMMPESYGFSMSYRVIFDQAVALLTVGGLTVYPAEGEPYAPALPDGDGYTHEIKHFAALVRGDETRIIISPEEARNSVKLALETGRR